MKKYQYNLRCQHKHTRSNFSIPLRVIWGACLGLFIFSTLGCKNEQEKYLPENQKEIIDANLYDKIKPDLLLAEKHFGSENFVYLPEFAKKMNTYTMATYGISSYNFIKTLDYTYAAYQESINKKAYLSKVTEGILSEQESQRISIQLEREIIQQGFDVAMHKFEQEIQEKTLTERQIVFYNSFFVLMKVLNKYHPLSSALSAYPIASLEYESFANKAAMDNCTVYGAVFVAGTAIAVLTSVFSGGGSLAFLGLVIGASTKMHKVVSECKLLPAIKVEELYLAGSRQDRITE